MAQLCAYFGPDADQRIARRLQPLLSLGEGMCHAVGAAGPATFSPAGADDARSGARPLSAVACARIRWRCKAPAPTVLTLDARKSLTKVGRAIRPLHLGAPAHFQSRHTCTDFGVCG